MKVLTIDLDQGIDTYDPRAPFSKCGLPVPTGCVDNARKLPHAVLDVFDDDLRRLAKTYDVCYWMHGWHCVPELRDALDQFKLTILFQGDDGPQSSEHKSFHLAGCFDVLLYTQYVWSMETGELTSDKYRALGLEDCRHVLLEWMDGLDVLPPRRRDITLSWVGLGFGNHSWSTGPNWRARFLAEANEREWPFPTRLHGTGMRDGVLGEVFRASDLCELYSRTRFGFTAQQVSVFNVRLHDLMVAGVVPLVYDPWKELDVYGFEPGVHYVPFDGTCEDVEEKCLIWTQSMCEPAAGFIKSLVAKSGLKATVRNVIKEYLG